MTILKINGMKGRYFQPDPNDLRKVIHLLQIFQIIVRQIAEKIKV